MNWLHSTDGNVDFLSEKKYPHLFIKYLRVKGYECGTYLALIKYQ